MGVKEGDNGLGLGGLSSLGTEWLCRQGLPLDSSKEPGSRVRERDELR